MPTKKHCKTCGQKHFPPTGKNCKHIVGTEHNVNTVQDVNASDNVPRRHIDDAPPGSRTAKTPGSNQVQSRQQMSPARPETLIATRTRSHVDYPKMLLVLPGAEDQLRTCVTHSLTPK